MLLEVERGDALSTQGTVHASNPRASMMRSAQLALLVAFGSSDTPPNVGLLRTKDRHPFHSKAPPYAGPQSRDRQNPDCGPAAELR